MAKSNQNFNVKDTVIIMINGEPLQTDITKKVTVETLNEKKEVVASYLYYTSATGDADPVKGQIFRNKEDMVAALTAGFVDTKPVK